MDGGRGLADIVMLDVSPLENIKNTRTIWRVIKGGWVEWATTCTPRFWSSVLVVHTNTLQVPPTIFDSTLSTM